MKRAGELRSFQLKILLQAICSRASEEIGRQLPGRLRIGSSQAVIWRNRCTPDSPAPKHGEPKPVSICAKQCDHAESQVVAAKAETCPTSHHAYASASNDFPAPE